MEHNGRVSGQPLILPWMNPNKKPTVLRLQQGASDADQHQLSITSFLQSCMSEQVGTSILKKQHIQQVQYTQIGARTHLSSHPFLLLPSLCKHKAQMVGSVVSLKQLDSKDRESFRYSPAMIQEAQIQRGILSGATELEDAHGDRSLFSLTVSIAQKSHRHSKVELKTSPTLQLQGLGRKPQEPTDRQMHMVGKEGAIKCR